MKTFVLVIIFDDITVSLSYFVNM